MPPQLDRLLGDRVVSAVVMGLLLPITDGHVAVCQPSDGRRHAMGNQAGGAKGATLHRCAATQRPIGTRVPLTGPG